MSFSELIAIGKEARDMRAEDRAKPLVDCPTCGHLLDKRGELYNCPLGHWRQTGTQRGPESV